MSHQRTCGNTRTSWSWKVTCAQVCRSVTFHFVSCKLLYAPFSQDMLISSLMDSLLNVITYMTKWHPFASRFFSPSSDELFLMFANLFILIRSSGSVLIIVFKSTIYPIPIKQFYRTTDLLICQTFLQNFTSASSLNWESEFLILIFDIESSHSQNGWHEPYSWFVASG